MFVEMKVPTLEGLTQGDPFQGNKHMIIINNHSLPHHFEAGIRSFNAGRTIYIMHD